MGMKLPSTGAKSKGAPPTPEKAIQAMILDYLALRGIFAVRFNSGAMVGEYKGKRRFVKFASVAGVSDILACWKGRMVAIEVKAAKGKLLPHQAAFLDSVRNAGGLAFVARSVADVEAALAGEL